MITSNVPVRDLHNHRTSDLGDMRLVAHPQQPVIHAMQVTIHDNNRSPGNLP
jgi:hypothetical protein